MEKTLNILLLGTAECGKSTVLKQMERKYNQKAFEEQRKTCSRVAKLNLIVATWQLLDARDNFGYHTEDADLENRFKDKTDFASPEKCNEKVPPKEPQEQRAYELFPSIVEEIKAIWRQRSTRDTLDRKAEFYLLDSAPYFMNRIDEVKMKDYVPTDEDVLKSRKQTTGIVDVEINARLAHDSVIFKITDVGGQRTESKYWFRVIKGVEVTSILYLFSLSDYNLEVQELLVQGKRGFNRMQENTKMFNSVINSQEMKNMNVIVFLNKKDIFEEKLRQVPLTVCYPDYPEDNRDPEAAIDFIESQIRSQDMHSAEPHIGASNAAVTAFGPEEEETRKREIMFFRTHATDPHQFQFIVDSVLQNIQTENLRRLGLI